MKMNVLLLLIANTHKGKYLWFSYHLEGFGSLSLDLFKIEKLVAHIQFQWIITLSSKSWYSISFWESRLSNPKNGNLNQFTCVESHSYLLHAMMYFTDEIINFIYLISLHCIQLRRTWYLLNTHMKHWFICVLNLAHR